MHDLNPTAASLLGFLHRGPMTGYDLGQVAEATIGAFWSLTSSQVYRELSRMEEDGLVAAGATGVRNRRPYELTDDGRTAFATWASQPVDEESIRFPLLLLLSLGAHVEPPVLEQHLRRHRILHEDRLRTYEEAATAADAASDADPWSRATLEFGLRYERLVLGWLDDLPDLLPQ